MIIRLHTWPNSSLRLFCEIAIQAYVIETSQKHFELCQLPQCKLTTVMTFKLKISARVFCLLSRKKGINGVYSAEQLRGGKHENSSGLQTSVKSKCG